MGELSLRIKLANREYPMKVKESEEENVREAAKKINEKVRSFRSQFGIEDKQDLLAMVSFDSTIKSIRKEKGEVLPDTFSKIQALNTKIEEILNE